MCCIVRAKNTIQHIFMKGENNEKIWNTVAIACFVLITDNNKGNGNGAK